MAAIGRWRAGVCAMGALGAMWLAVPSVGSLGGAARAGGVGGVVLGSEWWVGRWNGAIKTPGDGLGVSVVLEAGPGGPAGRIDIPQQGASGLALENVVVDGRTVSFRISGVPGEPTFTGSHDGDRISGEFVQGPTRLPFELSRAGAEEPVVARPQHPRAPLPYRSESVRVPAGGFDLAGTLTLPAGDGPFVAVVLVSGSGPQNRDSELFGHRPFAVWADVLTRAGVAVLRVDDRGVGESGGDRSAATTRDFADDALACVRWLAGRKDVSSVGVIGHSEGAVVAAMVAAESDVPRFVVLLAGSGLTGAQTLVAQNRALAIGAGRSASEAESVAEAAGAFFAAVQRDAEEPELLPLARELVSRQLAGRAVPTSAVEEAARGAVAQMRVPWFRAFLSLDPAASLSRVRVPVLAVFGGKDLQVVPEFERPAVESALRASPSRDVTVRTFDGVNHLLQPARRGTVDEYGVIETTVSPEVLEAVRSWVVERGGVVRP